MSTSTINKADFNAAVQLAIASIRPKLLAVEAAVADLHAVLAEQVVVAEAMGDGGGMHTESGGTDKGDAN